MEQTKTNSINTVQPKTSLVSKVEYVCPDCTEKIIITENGQIDNHHNIVCRGYPKVRYTKTQKKALKFSLKKAKYMSKNCKHILCERMAKMGYDPDNVDQVIEFAQQAGLTMHVPLIRRNLVDIFMKDPHLKNLFEVGHSGGCSVVSSRSSWETALFNGMYDEVEPAERVRYGAYNIDRNPKGVLGARNYGDVFLVFDEAVKKRTTIVYGDSSGHSQRLHMGSPKHLINILCYVTEPVLLTILEQVCPKDLNDPKVNFTQYGYIEAQIHGELRLDRDVDALAIFSKMNVEHLEQIQVLCDKYDIRIIDLSIDQNK